MLNTHRQYYFNNEIYRMPGTYNPIIDTGALPYENAVPAIDVLRANNHIAIPNYYKQYLVENSYSR